MVQELDQVQHMQFWFSNLKIYAQEFLCIYLDWNNFQ